MRRVLPFLALSFFLGAIGALAQDDATFWRFHAALQSAVKAGDKNKVADLTDFSDFYWDESDATRQVKTRADFLKHYDELFTPQIRREIATVEPRKDSTGQYHIAWKANDADYDFAFPPPAPGKDYRLEGLAVAPD